MILFGNACDNPAYFIYAFEQIGKIGIGKRIDGSNGTFTLREVYAGNEKIYSKTDGKIKNNLPNSF